MQHVCYLKDSQLLFDFVYTLNQQILLLDFHTQNLNNGGVIITDGTTDRRYVTYTHTHPQFMTISYHMHLIFGIIIII